MKKDFILRTPKNNILRVSVYPPKDKASKFCLIYVHGFKGFKDWGFVPYVGEYFSNFSYCVITFNFSHNGIGKSLMEFDELEKFANNTFSLEIDELNFIINSCKEGFFSKNSNLEIGIIGHSRGGAVAILTASRRNDISAIAAWASISKIDRYTEEQRKLWREKGFIEVLNTRTNQKMKLGLNLLDDIEQNKNDLLNIEKSVKNLKIPFFIAHGNQDVSVPFSESQDLYEWSNKEYSYLLQVPGVGHTFDITHPFDSSNSNFDFLLDNTRTFFHKHLIKGVK